MWALLANDNKTVINMVPPELSIAEIEKRRNGAVLIMMTLDNSPAYSGGEYRNGKFHKPKGME